MSNVTISVILPAYNAEETVVPALESICSQSFDAFECLVIDDGSEDATAARARSVTDSRVRVLSRPRKGLVAALNFGLQQARGTFIARMDADDLCAPERFARQLALLRSDETLAAVGCGVRLFPDKNVAGGMRHYIDWLNGLLSPEQIANNIFVEMPLLHPSMMLRVQAMRDVGGYRVGEFPEDYELLLRLHGAGWCFAKVPEVLFYWREHEHKLSRTHSAYSPAAFRRVKAKYLSQIVLAQRPEFYFWGVGRDGKKFARELQQRGYLPERFIDIDPKKIGSSYLGIPIISPEELPGSVPLILACVGSRGARAQIRDFLLKRGLVEGQDFLFLA